MVKSRASSGIGHNSGAEPSTPEDFRRALAIEILDQEEMAKIREKRKVNRKAAEGKRVLLPVLDNVYKHKDDTEDEIVIWFKNQLHGFSALFTDLGKQFGMFDAKPEATEVRGAARHHGFMAGITGKPNTAPPGTSGDRLQMWMEGWHEGHEARSDGEKEKLEIMRQALANADAGKVTDGKTGEAIEPKPARGAKAKAVGDKAAKDFAEDSMPDWSGYSNMPAEWGDEQRRVAKAWVDSVPIDVTPAIEHPGAKAFFDVQRTAGAGAPAIADKSAPTPADAQPSWDGFSVSNADWTVDQKATFAAWFLTLSDEDKASIKIDHQGAHDEFVLLHDMSRKPEEPAKPAKPESQSDKAARLAREAAAPPSKKAH